MKKKLIVSIFIIIIGLILTIFTYSNDFLYKDKIIKITNIKTIKEEIDTNELNIKEKHKYIKITGNLTNTKEKGKKETYKYEETSSSVVTEKYKIGDKVIIEKGEISTLKRDYYLTFLTSIFIIIMYLVGEKVGLLAILSVLLNTVIFVMSLNLYQKGLNLVLISIIESFVFTIISLIISCGYNKKTIVAIKSVFLSVTVLSIFLILLVLITNFNGINFNGLSFLTVPPEQVFLSELLIGGLGAIMDVAITISSSVSELIEKDNNISIENLKHSIKEIGKDIMSTMTNVLFFTYLCGGLPLFVLAIRNGFSMYNYISTNYTLEMMRFLTGAISLIMTIPISSYISIKYFKKEKIK